MVGATCTHTMLLLVPILLLLVTIQIKLVVALTVLPDARQENRMSLCNRRYCFYIAVVGDVSLKRLFLSPKPAFAVADSPPPPPSSKSQSLALAGLRLSLQQAMDQLNSIPHWIEREQWDTVRTILIQPPLGDCWGAHRTLSSSSTPSSSRSVMSQYATTLGDAGGDELAALELRETLLSHLRYLDMAVYNNVFNPITSQGKTGASPELIRSYYEDPMNEYTASRNALKQLIELSEGMI